MWGLKRKEKEKELMVWKTRDKNVWLYKYTTDK